jgi:uncharacterized membrane protein
MRRLILILLLILGTAALAQPVEGWKERGNDQFRVYHHPEEAINVSELLEELERIKPELEKRLEVTFPGPPRIFVVSSQEEFDRATAGRLPAWSQGVSFPMNGTIVLKSPSFSEGIETFHRTAAHELVHLMLGVKAGSGIPRWLNEGLAQLLSGEGPGKPRVRLSRALWSGKLLPLSSIEAVDSFPHSQADLAYLQSYSATEYLLKQYGWEVLRESLVKLGQGIYWDEALFETIEIDQAGFQAAWLASLETSHRWLILLDLHLYLFAGATLLVIWSGVAIIRRRRKIYRQWEAEDSHEQGIF